MTPTEALRAILEIAYAGHPDGREVRLEMIRRYAEAGLHPEVEMKSESKVPPRQFGMEGF